MTTSAALISTFFEYTCKQKELVCCFVCIDTYGVANPRSISAFHGHNTERLQQFSVAYNKGTNSSHY